jgi:MSHA biogenesis protein MshQ
MTAGTGILKLAKSNNVAGNVGLAYNLGSTGADVSCLADHPATTGAARPWLRSLNGCANDYGRDPSSRATFGVFKPETKSIIHVRERFD